MRKMAAVLLTALLTVPPAQLASAAPALGTVQGAVTLSGRPLAGVDLAFIERQTGAVQRASSGKNGAFEAHLLPGDRQLIGRYLLPVHLRHFHAAGIVLVLLAKRRQGKNKHQQDAHQGKHPLAVLL